MKTLVLGDIHGRTIWKDIMDRERPDRTIFLGDYVSSHYDISGQEQISNLAEILDLKEANQDTVFLLRGNHDMQHLGYPWAQCSGYNPWVAANMPRERFLELTQWVVVDDRLNTAFSHAGISKVWMSNCGISDIHDINNMQPSPLFGFIPDNWFDYSGDSVTQPPTWIRPDTLSECNVRGWRQVVGHTPVMSGIVDIDQYVATGEHIWLCDALELKQYMTIDDGTFTVKTTKD